MEVRYWIANSEKVAGHKRKHKNAQKIFSSVLRLLHGSSWRGACHASSAITHMLLSEMGIENELYIGEARLSRVIFDHSWIEIDGNIIDSAVSLPLVPQFWAPPVFLGKDLQSLSDTAVIYGPSTSGLDEQAKSVLNDNLGWYMTQFPDHPEGLAGLVVMAGSEVGMKLNVNSIRDKYSATRWREKI